MKKVILINKIEMFDFAFQALLIFNVQDFHSCKGNAMGDYRVGSFTRQMLLKYLFLCLPISSEFVYSSNGRT